MGWVRAVLAAAAAAVALAGCGGPVEQGTAAPVLSGPVYPTAGAVEVSPTSTGEAPGRDDHGDERAPVAPPPAAQAPRVAAAFAAAWARPDLPTEVWWQRVAPHCEEGFARALRTVDPAQVPARRVTGRPAATRAPKGGAAVYEVPTDAGTLTVTLAAVNGRWVVTGNDFVRAVQ
ncbi:hypothetical protein GA0070606_0028 [Micromonospora citrea]|uniref:Lipoprotein n=1 Tax=Micromonospora citrea TaxID=47855 RepID=A0A1C6TPY3_9ACTN|nr:hypothetical protein GA0070606_0028 [Micromonospora citrea]